jgi:hypothetical protein
VVTSEERLKILNLVQQGKITPQEGIRLLEALDKSRAPQPGFPTPQPPPPPFFGSGGPRWLRVRVTDTASGKVRVNVRLPVTVLNAGVKMGARFSPEIKQEQMGEILDAIRAGEVGQVVDVYNDEDGEHVEVLLE